MVGLEFKPRHLEPRLVITALAVLRKKAAASPGFRAAAWKDGTWAVFECPLTFVQRQLCVKCFVHASLPCDVNDRNPSHNNPFDTLYWKKSLCKRCHLKKNTFKNMVDYLGRYLVSFLCMILCVYSVTSLSSPIDKKCDFYEVLLRA